VIPSREVVTPEVIFTDGEKEESCLFSKNLIESACDGYKDSFDVEALQGEDEKT